VLKAMRWLRVVAERVQGAGFAALAVSRMAPESLEFAVMGRESWH